MPFADFLTPGQPVAPQQPVVQQPIAPAQQPQMQQPQAPQTGQVASQWQAIFQAMNDPTVMGPLQTFLGTVAAPLRPGETMGVRMGQAAMMMNLHKQMMQENAANAPLLQQERKLKMRQLEAQTAGAESDMEYKQQTMGDRIEKEKQLLANAKRTGDREEILIAQERLKQAIEEKTGLRKAEADIRYKDQLTQTAAAQGRSYDRLPAESTSKEEKKQYELIKAKSNIEALANQFKYESQGKQFTSQQEMQNEFLGWLAGQTPETQRNYAQAYNLLKSSGQSIPSIYGSGVPGAFGTTVSGGKRESLRDWLGK